MRLTKTTPAALIVALVVTAYSGCSLFEGSMPSFFARSQRKQAKGLSFLRPLRRAQDSVRLEIIFVERPRTDPLLGETLWRDIAQIGTLSPEVRARLNENGFRVGHISSTPPPALETLLGLKTEISGNTSPGQEKRLVSHHIDLLSGSETEVQTSPYYPQLEITLPTEQGVRIKGFENARCVFRIKAQKLQKGWATLEFQPEIHHGLFGWRPVASEIGWTGGTKQVIHPLFANRFSVSLNRGEMVILSADGKDSKSLGNYFFRGHEVDSRIQRLLIIRLVELPTTELTYAQ